MTKRSLYGVWVLYFVSIAVLVSPMTGIAQEDVSKFPTRPITYIQPFTAGVPADLAMRLISKEAEKFLGKPIIVVNKPGAVGTIGVAAVAAAIPDGYTIGNTPHSPMFVIPHLDKSHLAIGVGAWLGTIMLFNVWVLIWPNQKKILGMVQATDEEKNKARRIAFLASRTNTMLSIPLLYFMAAGAHSALYFG